MDNGKTIGMPGEVRYADVVSNSGGIAMLVRLSSAQAEKLERTFLIFTYKDQNDQIRLVPDNVPGVSCRTGQQGWIDSTNMLQCLNEKRAIKEFPDRKRQKKMLTLFIDNCSFHIIREYVLNLTKSIRPTLLYFPANTTELNQPCDYFVIQKLKDALRKRCDEYKLCLSQRVVNKLPNPGNF